MEVIEEDEGISIEIKLLDLFDALRDVGYYDFTELHEVLCERGCSKSKIFCCLFYVYQRYDYGFNEIWELNSDGHIFCKHRNRCFGSSKKHLWYLEARAKHDFILSPLPVYCPLSGSYKIIENQKIIRVASDRTLVKRY
jgi:hypothetical protein